MASFLDKSKDTPPSSGHADEAESDSAGSSMQKAHCHSSCSSTCSSCFKKTRSGMNYGPRCGCVEPASPEPESDRALASICKDFLIRKRLKRRNWMLLLMVALVGLTLCVVVARSKDVIQHPLHGVKTCLRPLWWLVEVVTRTILAVLGSILKCFLWSCRGLKGGGKELILLKPLIYSKNQTQHIYHLSANIIGKVFSAPWTLFRRRKEEVSEHNPYEKAKEYVQTKVFKKEEKQTVSPIKKGFLTSGRFLKKTEEKMVSGTKKGIVMPWRFSHKQGGKMASAAKKGFIMTMLNRKVTPQKKSTSLYEKGHLALRNVYKKTKNFVSNKRTLPMIVMLACHGFFNAVVTLAVLLQFWFHHIEVE